LNKKAKRTPVRDRSIGEKAPVTKGQKSSVEAIKGGDLNFGARNYTALGAALTCILLGFLLLSRGSITAAPVLLVLGYCVLIPYGLATGKTSTPGE
jgi:hypothetical protein